MQHCPGVTSGLRLTTELPQIINGMCEAKIIVHMVVDARLTKRHIYVCHA